MQYYNLLNGGLLYNNSTNLNYLESLKRMQYSTHCKIYVFPCLKYILKIPQLFQDKILIGYVYFVQLLYPLLNYKYKIVQMHRLNIQYLKIVNTFPLVYYVIHLKMYNDKIYYCLCNFFL